jgi:hypothetical protein
MESFWIPIVTFQLLGTVVASRYTSFHAAARLRHQSCRARFYQLEGFYNVKKVLFTLGAVSLFLGWIQATTLIAIALLAIFAFGKVEFSS